MASDFNEDFININKISSKRWVKIGDVKIKNKKNTYFENIGINVYKPFNMFFFVSIIINLKLIVKEEMDKIINYNFNDETTIYKSKLNKRKYIINTVRKTEDNCKNRKERHYDVLKKNPNTGC